jgi:hypothetical protein
VEQFIEINNTHGIMTRNKFIMNIIPFYQMP